MELPKGIETHHGSSKDHVIMLLANLYGKKTSRMCLKLLHEKLHSIGFQQSLVDE
jgi:hypothetical protein